MEDGSTTPIAAEVISVPRSQILRDQEEHVDQHRLKKLEEESERDRQIEKEKRELQQKRAKQKRCVVVTLVVGSRHCGPTARGNEA